VRMVVGLVDFVGALRELYNEDGRGVEMALLD
jgi:hypothetical protein